MNHSNSAPAYGLWSLVFINSLVFIIFAFSFAKPQSPRDWRSFGAFSAFLITLVMFPVLVGVYARLARTEERWALAEFGDEYRRYMARTPAFIPRIGLNKPLKA